MRATSAFLVAVVITGCSSHATPYGGHVHSSLGEEVPVQVYSRETDIHEPYEAVGLVSASDWGKFRVLGLEDSFPALRSKARSLGANAVVIDGYQPVKSGIISTGYSVYGRAIRIKPVNGKEP